MTSFDDELSDRVDEEIKELVDEDENLISFKSFIQDNYELIAIIGVFTALSTYLPKIHIQNSNLIDVAVISTISLYILTSFLLLKSLLLYCRTAVILRKNYSTVVGGFFTLSILLIVINTTIYLFKIYFVEIFIYFVIIISFIPVGIYNLKLAVRHELTTWNIIAVWLVLLSINYWIVANFVPKIISAIYNSTPLMPSSEVVFLVVMSSFFGSMMMTMYLSYNIYRYMTRLGVYID